ncbi:hypothetical protein Sta7437_4488 [Stanieria cyanosphaera PCC 7437]|uniref:Uncharacterized protein n=1 Tax=Stanieria cyanosphaera (strain ATCC 29371 / PCC 7437) TaxID=111780 RepID=K9Y1T4_STAC7|nr:nucleotide exchange factor GrpE [Stanieria cyanosphaera]AFZ37952.1 hypothetical protein Sta7437_4488 [Stanieria cyanosphaera PCC 7437]
MLKIFSSLSSSFLETIFPWLEYTKYLENLKILALKAENQARHLNQLSPLVSHTKFDDPLDILKSICNLLERLDDSNFNKQKPNRQSKLNLVKHNTESREIKPNLLANLEPDWSASKEKLILIDSENIDNQKKINDACESKNLELFITIQELIKIRDWILFARSEETLKESKILQEIDRQLEGVLIKENVFCVEKGDLFDSQIQIIVGTTNTEESSKHNYICSTVRPGYFFYDQLIRLQEVIVYVFEDGC